MTLSGLIIYEVAITGGVGAVACRHDGGSMATLWVYPLLACTYAFKCALYRRVCPLFYDSQQATKNGL